MPVEQAVVIDTNFFGLLNRIDSDCELIDLICESYSSKGFADQDQLAMMDYCQDLKSKLQHHGVSDEEVSEFIFNYSGKMNLARINEDPVDLKLIVFTKNHGSASFLTCEAKLLELCEEQNIRHSCFKATLHHLDGCVGGIFNDAAYCTNDMFDRNGGHPFFHYADNRRCDCCDKSGFCVTRTNPPQSALFGT
jgi:hypothetical protein